MQLLCGELEDALLMDHLLEHAFGETVGELLAALALGHQSLEAELGDGEPPGALEHLADAPRGGHDVLDALHLIGEHPIDHH